MVHDEVDVQILARAAERIGKFFKALFGTVERRFVPLAQVEAIVHVVPHGVVTRVTAVGRWGPDSTIAGLKEIGCTIDHGVVRGLEPLEDRCRGGVDTQKPARLEGLVVELESSRGNAFVGKTNSCRGAESIAGTYSERTGKCT